MVVEGDDGLAVLRTSSGVSVVPDPEFFTRLGFEIKMVVHDDFSSAGFCQMIGSNGHILTDPVKKMLVTGWTMSVDRFKSEAVRLGLLRAKALSLMVESPHCPVVKSMAKWLLRVTCGVKARFETSWWDRERHRMIFGDGDPELMAAAVESLAPTYQDRVLVESVFRIPVPYQHLLEKWFEAQTALCVIPFRLLEPLAQRDWLIAWNFVSRMVVKPALEAD